MFELCYNMQQIFWQVVALIPQQTVPEHLQGGKTTLFAARSKCLDNGTEETTGFSKSDTRLSSDAKLCQTGNAKFADRMWLWKFISFLGIWFGILQAVGEAVQIGQCRNIGSQTNRFFPTYQNGIVDVIASRIRRVPFWASCRGGAPHAIEKPLVQVFES